MAITKNCLKNALAVAYSEFKFAVGTQQDPAEFVDCASLQNFLSANNFSSSFKCKKFVRCIGCLKHSEIEVYEQNVLVLRMFEELQSGSSLNLYIDKYLSEVTKENCNYCLQLN